MLLGVAGTGETKITHEQELDVPVLNGQLRITKIRIFAKSERVRLPNGIHVIADELEADALYQALAKDNEAVIRPNYIIVQVTIANETGDAVVIYPDIISWYLQNAFVYNHEDTAWVISSDISTKPLEHSEFWRSERRASVVLNGDQKTLAVTMFNASLYSEIENPPKAAEIPSELSFQSKIGTEINVNVIEPDAMLKAKVPLQGNGKAHIIFDHSELLLMELP